MQRWQEQIMQLPYSRSAGNEQSAKSHLRSGMLKVTALEPGRSGNNVASWK
jgi:hypothetical protein